jgi:uncharacterized membrane protein YfcA
LAVVSEPWRTILTLGVGFATGVLSAMFGVGGAVVSTPPIRALGATPLEGVGSTLPSILPSAISGSLRYQREGLIVYRVALWTAMAGVFAAVGGALLAGSVPGDGHLLMIATALLLAFTAYRTGRAPDPAPEPAVVVEDPVGDLVMPTADLRAARGGDPGAAPHQEPWRLVLIGLAAGLLSGLLGIGGGVLMVPAFIGWVRLAIKEAVATSLLCVGVLAIPGTITHTILGNVDWAFAIPLCIGVVPGAQVGAHLAIRASDRGLRLAVAVVLGTIAVLYLAGEVLALI